MNNNRGDKWNIVSALPIIDEEEQIEYCPLFVKIGWRALIHERQDRENVAKRAILSLLENYTNSLQLVNFHADFRFWFLLLLDKFLGRNISLRPMTLI